MIIWLNGTPSTDYNITVSGVQRPLLPARTPREITVPGYPGTYDFGNPNIGKREYKITCHFEPMTGKTLVETAQAIALWLISATSMILEDQPDIAWTGYVLSNVDLDNMVALGRFSFSFVAQPYGEDVEETTGIINVAQDYGSALPFAPLIIIELAEATNSLQVQLISTGQFVRIEGALAADDIIVFDMTRGLVTHNGLSVMPLVSLDSQFFRVPPGEQLILTTPASGLTGQIIYKRQYL